MSLILTRTPPIPPHLLARIGPDIEYAGKTPGSDWKGIRHTDLLACLQREVWEGIGKPPSGGKAWTTCNGGNLYACFQSGLGDKWVGVTASNVGRASLRVFAGAVLDGARLISDAMLGGRYTLSFDLQSECRSLAAGWKEAVGKCGVLERELKSCILTTGDVMSLLMSAGRAKLLTWRQVGRVDGLFKTQPDSTAWDLLRAFSTGTDTTPVADQMNDLLAFRRMLSRKTFNRSA